MADEAKYPHWHHPSICKTPGPDVPWPYSTPKETDAAVHDAQLNKELGIDKVYDPLALRNASPTPGPQTPPAYGEDNTIIPSIHLPTSGGSGDSGVGGLASGVASPVTKHDDRLLDGLPPGLPMELGISWVPGSSRASSRETPMSLGSPNIPGAEWGGMLKWLLNMAPNLTTFADAMKRMQREAKRKQLEEQESPYPADKEDNPDWM